MFCTKCGTQVADTDKFCPECGAPIEWQMPSAPVNAPQPAPKKSHKALWITLTCVALAIALAAIVIFVWRPWSRCSKPDAPIADLSPEETVRTAFEALNGVDSMHLDFSESIVMSVGIPLIDYTQNMNIAIVLGVDTNRDPKVTRTEGYMEMLDERQPVLMYAEETDGKTVSYRSTDDGKTWTQEDVEFDDNSILQNPAETIDLWMKHAKNFETTGVETLNGFETTVISGTLSGEYLREATGMTGELFGGLEEELLEGLDDLPITFWIDNASGCVVRMHIDMQDMMKSILEKVMEKSMGELSDSMEVSIEVSEATVDCVMTQFNAVPPIVIPDEAKSAPAPVPEPEAESIVGAWTLYGGEDEETQQYVDLMLGMGMEMTFEFNEDGTGAVVTAFQGEEDREEFTYTLENGEIVIDGDGAPYRIEDDLLYLSADGTKLIFKRK